MLKEKVGRGFLFLPVFIMACFMFYKCLPVEDDFLQQTIQNKDKLDVQIVSWQHFMELNDELYKKIEMLRKPEILEKNLTSNTYDFWIDESEVQIIHFQNYSTYVFKVQRTEKSDGVLENYLLKRYSDNKYEQYLIKYYYQMNGEGERIYDLNKFDFSRIDDESLLFSRECVPHFESELVMSCVTYTNCTGPGNHEPGDDNCTCETLHPCYRAGTTVCDITEVFTFVDCPYGGGQDPVDPPNDGSGGGTGGATGGSDSSVEGDASTTTTPFDNLINDCSKVKNFIDTNLSFKAVIQQQALDYKSGKVEISALKYNRSNNIQVDMGTPAKPEIKVTYDVSTNTIQAFSHVHYEDPATPGGDTYSVFSPDDLLALAQLSRAGALDPNFTAYLATGKDTYYALSIADAQKLEDFFRTKLEAPPNTGVIADLNEYYDNLSKFTRIHDKYFHKDKGIISKDNASTDYTLGAFMAFLEEADVGINLYQTEATFSTFTKVSRNPDGAGFHNQFTTQPCPN